MRTRGSWILVSAIAVVVGLGTGALAQSQTVTATVASEDVTAPDQLPGTYEASLVVTVEAAGGQCMCTETTVTVLGNSSEVRSFSFEPETYTIDWTQNTNGSHEQAVSAQLDVDELDVDGEATIDVEMSHQPDDQAVDSQTNPAQLVLEEPQTEANQTAANDTNQTQTQSAEDEEASGVPAPGVGLAVIGTALAAALRRSEG
jgi:hypothetical protein